MIIYLQNSFEQTFEFNTETRELHSANVKKGMLITTSGKTAETIIKGLAFIDYDCDHSYIDYPEHEDEVGKCEDCGAEILWHNEYEINEFGEKEWYPVYDDFQHCVTQDEREFIKHKYSLKD